MLKLFGCEGAGERGQSGGGGELGEGGVDGWESSLSRRGETMLEVVGGREGEKRKRTFCKLPSIPLSCSNSLRLASSSSSRVVLVLPRFAGRSPSSPSSPFTRSFPSLSSDKSPSSSLKRSSWKGRRCA